MTGSITGPDPPSARTDHADSNSGLEGAAEPSTHENPSPAGGAASPAGVRRTAGRVPYPVVQSVAPMGHGRLPHPREFKPVACHDISLGGFSYFTDTKPQDKFIVVCLGSGTAAKHLIAEVVNCRIAVSDGILSYIVGCRFIDRANPS